MIRLLDIFLSCFGIILSIPLTLLLIFFGIFDTGSPIFTQVRVGRNQQPFTLFKFRTMAKNTQSVASHLAVDAVITPYGRFLRRSKLDELPQLLNVLKGDMSLVGPRPGLFNQTDLIAARQKEGVYKVRPGITGLAQIGGIDMSTPELLAKTDAKMISEMSFQMYFGLIFATVKGQGQGDSVSR